MQTPVRYTIVRQTEQPAAHAISISNWASDSTLGRPAAAAKERREHDAPEQAPALRVIRRRLLDIR